jgi:chemotaxis protein histidine kinase CheA
MICPNCGRETTGDLCQWCGYPIVKGSLIKRQRLRKDAEGAEEKAKEEAKEAEERTKREVEEVKEAKQAKGAKEKTKAEAKEAKEKAKREAEKAKQAKRAKEASEKAKKEEAKAKQAKQAKEAKEKAKKAAKEAREKAKKEAKEEELEPAATAKLYEGAVELAIVPPIDLAQMENLAKGLSQVENLRLILVGGSVDRGSRIIVSAEEPVPLLSILREMPVVEQVDRKGAEIQVRLKAK